MSDGKLAFIRPADGSARLVFGDAAEVVTPQTSAGVDAEFSDDMPASFSMFWDPNVSRGVCVQTRSVWQVGAPVASLSATRWQNARPAIAMASTHWQTGAPAVSLSATRWQDSQPLASLAAVGWQSAAPVRQLIESRWQEARRVRGLLAARWQDPRPVRGLMAARWQEAIRHRVALGVRWQDAAPEVSSLSHRGRSGVPVAVTLAAHWQDARRPLVGRSLYVQPPDPPEPPCFDPATLGRLEFSEAWSNDGRLVFVCIRGDVDPGPGAPLQILPARFYMAVHSLVAYRLPDLAEVGLFDVSVSADEGSYGWSFSAQASEDAFYILEPSGLAPSQIRIELDGLVFVFAITGREKPAAAYGEMRSTSLSGVSLSVALAQPIAREQQWINSTQRTAQQLALTALEYTGFSLDWGLPEAIVPAGVLSHTGTPLSLVQALAEAAGGYLQSHRSAPTVLVRHPFPGALGAPWDWYNPAVVPDVELTPDVFVTTGIEWIGGQDVNSVYVSGVNQGPRAFVKRGPTIGDKLWGYVAEPLIADGSAARMRGVSILGRALTKERITGVLPILTGPGQPGLLDVGQLVQVNTSPMWRGRVVAVTGGGRYGDKVRQTVQIDRYL